MRKEHCKRVCACLTVPVLTCWWKQVVYLWMYWKCICVEHVYEHALAAECWGCCNVSQRVAVLGPHFFQCTCFSVLGLLQCVAVVVCCCCSVLLYVAVHCSVLHCVAFLNQHACSVLQCVVCFNQHVFLCTCLRVLGLLQCVLVCCSVFSVF